LRFVWGILFITPVKHYQSGFQKKREIDE